MARASRKEAAASAEAGADQTTETDEAPTSTQAASVLVAPLSSGQIAYYSEQFATAAAHFEAALADPAYDEASRAKAAYWRAEARLQAEFTADKVALFEDVARRFDDYPLGSAAARRADALRIHFAAFEEEETGTDAAD